MHTVFMTVRDGAVVGTCMQPSLTERARGAVVGERT